MERTTCLPHVRFITAKILLKSSPSPATLKVKMRHTAGEREGGENSPTAPMPAPPPGLLLHILPRLMTFLNPDVSQQAKREGMRESHSFFFPPSFRPSSFPVLVSDLLCQSLKFILFHFDLFVSISCFPSTCV